MLLHAQCQPIVIIPQTVVQNVATLTPRPKTDIQSYAHDRIVETFGEDQWDSFDWVVKKESGWNPNAVNKSSGACGIPQALPCSKLPDHSPEGQVDWMIAYIQDRYDTPSQARSFHLSHGWY